MSHKLIKALPLLVIAFFCLATTSLKAQNYYGSASVAVRSKTGTYRVINVVSENPLYRPKRTAEVAKEELLTKLKQEISYDEEMVEAPAYAVEKATADSYRGQASVRVAEKGARSRVIVVSTNEYETDKTLLGRKRELLQKLKAEKRYNEEFIESVTYNLNN